MRRCLAGSLPALLAALAMVVPTRLPCREIAGSAVSLNGKRMDPLAESGGSPVALIFVRRDCPISARYAPLIQQLHTRYGKEAHFYLVFPDKSESPVEIRKYLRAYGYSIPPLRDPDHSLAQRAQAHVTPEAAVFDAKGSLVYHGRIDNLYADIAKARPAATTHELEDALRAAIHGTPVAVRETQAVGCYIADLP